MTDLDELRLRVVPGDGVVLRAPGLTAVAFPTDEEQHELVTAFLQAVRDAAGRADAGRQATRSVAGLLAAADSAPPLGLVGTDGAGLAVLLHGDVEFAYRDGDGAAQTLSGGDAAAWLDRLLDAVPAVWSLARDGAGAADEWSDLQAGVARGNGVATGSAAPTTPAPSVETDAATEVEPPTAPQVEIPAPAPPPAPDVDIEPVPAADFIAVSLTDPEPDLDEAEPARDPLPVAGADLPPPPAPEGREESEVHGVLCARGHFNDPSSPFCATCGISMVQQTHNLVKGPRPPLGVLVLDDGSTYVVDRDIVLGREPAVDGRVAGGDVRGITLTDPERAISRVHARVTLHDWEARLSDAGSANGTFVAGRDGTAWTPVTADRPVTLTPGMHVLVGPRVISFDSHRRS